VKISVRYFASLVDRTGTASETVEVDAEASVAELWSRLIEKHPRLKDVGIRPLVACDLEYATWERPLDGVREVAFLPPVSGG
jgi:molybdopterin synthase sulfur carrier subunit